MSFSSSISSLVGLEPINGFHESKNISDNDQLPSTEADLSITAVAAVAESATATATATITTPSTTEQLPLLTEVTAAASVSVSTAVASTSATEISENPMEISPIEITPMEIDVNDAPPNIDLSTGVDSSDVPQVDLESDVLREFLESETTDLSATDDVGIEQMLMA